MWNWIYRTIGRSSSWGRVDNMVEQRNFQALESEVLAAFPKEFWSKDPGDLQTYGKDWTKFIAPNPSAVAFPTSTEQVAKLMRLCAKHQVPVVPSGGRTGLSGGAIAAHGEVVL